MDASRFDAVARTATRRGALVALAGGGLARLRRLLGRVSGADRGRGRA